jgi:hypothetical protein
MNHHSARLTASHLTGDLPFTAPASISEEKKSSQSKNTLKEVISLEKGISY